MTIALMTAVIWVGALAAGLLGSLTGLGGGVIVVPLLTLALHVDIRYAIGASLLAVIATSSGSAAAYVKEGYTNVRIGMLLEIATTFGALGGAFLAGVVSTSAVGVVFGVVLIASALMSLRPKEQDTGVSAPRVGGLGARLRLDGSYPGPAGPIAYEPRRVPLGFAVMAVAGALSGLLGIGSGALKVLAMDQAMALPFKVSTTTSNFMIGVTAAASAGIYVSRGYVDPGLALPVVLGILPGALLGARVLPKAKSSVLRVLFGLAIVAIGVEMISSAVRGQL